jgi:alcohol dehydrogenase class IV
MAAPEKYAEIARLLDAADETTPDREAAKKASDAVLELCTSVNLSSYLDEFGEVPDRETYLDIVSKMASDAIDSGSPDNNPRKPTESEIEELFIKIYDDTLAPDSPRRTSETV